jgi:hypothetical protein
MVKYPIFSIIKLFYHIFSHISSPFLPKKLLKKVDSYAKIKIGLFFGGILMLKRALSLALCGIFVILSLFSCAYTTDNGAVGYDFGDRILYGGYAVDVENGTVFSENGGVYFTDIHGNESKIADGDAKYLNYFEEKLYFVSGNSIMRANADMSNTETLYSFDGEVKCLYATADGLYYQRGSTVYLNDGSEKALLTRDGIEGFVPESRDKIRWAAKNPQYKYIEESGDEVWNESQSLYLEYTATVGTDKKQDVIYAQREMGVALSSAGEYTGPVVEVGETTLPLAEHMPGTFFSKNGKACTCHNNPTNSTYCIQSVGNCNCMRYYPTGYKESCEIDLLGAQCFAFARMVFWKCFGFIDHSMNASLYYSVGSLGSGAVTANSVKKLLMKAAPGAHIRLAAGHSVSILTMDEDFIVIYHGNAGGDGVVSQPCIVSTRRYTWEQFATAAARGILYVNMPINYPDSEVILSKKEVGFYKLKSNLNLRTEPNTQSESLSVVPNGSIVDVKEIDGFWGKIEYNGLSGWIFLEYTTYLTRETITPSGNVFKKDGNGYLRAAAWQLNLDAFSEHFDKQNLTVTAYNGKTVGDSDYIGTGAVVSLTVDGVVLDSATVCLAGDVNRNGRLDIGDYILIKRCVMKTYSPDAAQSVSADVSANGSIDSYDYLLLKRYFLEDNINLFSAFLSK